MMIEPQVTFLNVDLELYGDFDRETLIKAFGRSVGVLHEGAAGGNPLVLEVVAVGLDVSETIARFIRCIDRLPKKALAVWHAADRRRFNIGILAGKRPYSTSWTLSPEMIARIGELHAELTITIYGAEMRTSRRAAPRG